MAVIINEFEVVVEAEESESSAETEASESQQATPLLAPHDLYDVTRHEYRRMIRVWAD